MVSEATWPELFRAQVRRNPAAPAVVFNDTTLTYAKLDTRANRLAHALLSGGAGPEQVMALALPRSAELIVAQVAVLKAGAAYLSLDPDYPAERLAFMLGDAKPVAVLTTAELAGQLPSTDHTPRLHLDRLETAAAGSPETDPTDEARGGALRELNAAYVIYTSGSTGRPKGVVLSHTGVAKLVATQTQRFGVGPHSRILQFASPSFDVAFWDLCLALLSGGRLVVVPAERRFPGPELADYAHEHGVTVMALPPSLLAAFPADCTLPPATLLTGTERVSPELVERWGRGRRMFNAYGPTEATVNSTLGECHPDRLRRPSVPIGVPDPMTTAYVLDDRLHPTVDGADGELYLGGPGLARGYLGRPDRTAERFVANPFGEPGARLYRTGDLVRRDAGGSLDFLGRVDDQLKIRGYRIEPGEIESVLARHESIAHVSVAVREDQAGGRRLVAYVVPTARPASGGVYRPVRDTPIESPADPPAVLLGTEALLTSLRSHAARWLPEYLVPAAFVPLPWLPVLPNGKLDRTALPIPDFGASATGHRPRSNREKLLCALYAEVLGVPGIGIDDDFYTLGGDSIVSIQLVIRARQAGLIVTPRQVFTHRTVAELAPLATAVTQQSAEEPPDGVGTLPLTPIMRWLDECGGPTDSFSQSMLMGVPAGLTSDQLATVVQAVADKHDVLRSRIVRPSTGNPGMLQVPPPGSVPADSWIRQVDVTGADGAQLRRVIDADSEAAGRRLAPEAGVMVQVVWFNAGATQPGRLLFVVHHWVVDGVSWRILLPDLAAAWEAVTAGRRPELGPAGTSFRRWAQLVDAEARAPDRVAELALWTGILDGPDPALTDRPLDPVSDLKSVRRLTLRLPADRTVPLLTSVPAAFHAEVNDVLLTALALAVADWRRRRGWGTDPTVLIALEGHGREEQIADGVDLSRTLGWFTSIFPVRLDPGPIDITEAFGGGPAAGHALKRIKEQLRALPDHGVGFGLLRYLNPETAPALAVLRVPQISFNYLGRFTVDNELDALWTAVPGAGVLEGGFDAGIPVAPHLLDINAFCQDVGGRPELGVTWAWPGDLLDEDIVADLARSWFDALDALGCHADRPGAGGHTPSDLGLVSLSQEEIDEFEAEWELS